MKRAYTRVVSEVLIFDDDDHLIRVLENVEADVFKQTLLTIQRGQTTGVPHQLASTVDRYIRCELDNMSLGRSRNV